MSLRNFEFSKINPTVLVNHNPRSLTFIIIKMTIVYISISMLNPTKSLSQSFLEATLVCGIVQAHLTVRVMGCGLTLKRYLLDTSDECSDNSIMFNHLHLYFLKPINFLLLEYRIHFLRITLRYWLLSFVLGCHIRRRSLGRIRCRNRSGSSLSSSIISSFLFDFLTSL